MFLESFGDELCKLAESPWDRIERQKKERHALRKQTRANMDQLDREFSARKKPSLGIIGSGVTDGPRQGTNPITYYRELERKRKQSAMDRRLGDAQKGSDWLKAQASKTESGKESPLSTPKAEPKARPFPKARPSSSRSSGKGKGRSEKAQQRAFRRQADRTFKNQMKVLHSKPTSSSTVGPSESQKMLERADKGDYIQMNQPNLKQMRAGALRGPGGDANPQVKQNLSKKEMRQGGLMRPSFGQKAEQAEQPKKPAPPKPAMKSPEVGGERTFRMYQRPSAARPNSPVPQGIGAPTTPRNPQPKLMNPFK